MRIRHLSLGKKLINLKKEHPMSAIFGGLIFILTIFALVDVLRNEFIGSNKIIWLLTVILLPVIGFILYFFIGREQRVISES